MRSRFKIALTAASSSFADAVLMATDLAMRQQIESGSPAIQAAALTHCMQQSILDPEYLLLAIPLTNSVHELFVKQQLESCERDDEWTPLILPGLMQLVSASSGDALYGPPH